MISLFLFALSALAAPDVRSYTEPPPKELWVADCPSGLRLQIVRDWESTGFLRVTKPAPGYFDWAAGLRADVEKLSLSFGELLLPKEDVGLRKQIDLTDEGKPDSKSRAVGECALRPFALDATDVRPGPKFLARAADFQKLPPLDRQVALLILSGFRPGVLRALFDQNSATWSPEERLDRLGQSGIAAARYGDVDLLTGERTFTRVNGRLRVARAAQVDAELRWDAGGNLRDVDVKSGRPFVPAQIVAGTPFWQTSGSLTCQRAIYRANGSITLCDQRYFDDQGLPVATMPVFFAGTESRNGLDVRGYYYDSPKFLRHVILSNAGSEVARVVSLPNVNRPVSAIYPLVGEPSCEGATFKAGERLEITLPAECTGVFRVDL